eukprot:m.232956 g.232956  ORF g.232956 m.232956 type:complete len:121 (+) comp12440_c0_seq1:207-569(+)
MQKLPFHATEEERDVMARRSMLLLDSMYSYPAYVQYSPALIAASALFCAIVGVEPTATSPGATPMYECIPAEFLSSHMELAKFFPGLEKQLVACRTHICECYSASASVAPPPHAPQTAGH